MQPTYYFRRYHSHHGFIFECERFLFLIDIQNDYNYTVIYILYKTGLSSIKNESPAMMYYCAYHEWINNITVFYIHKNNMYQVRPWDHGTRHITIISQDDNLSRQCPREYIRDLNLPEIRVPKNFDGFIEPTYRLGNYYISKEFIFVRDYRIPFRAPPRIYTDVVIECK
jgi:hypothetical protein